MTVRRHLLSALQRAFPVQFVPGESERREALDATIVFGDMRAAGVGGIPCLVLAGGPAFEGRRRRGCVDFTQTSLLDPRLRGRCLHDDRAAGGPRLALRRGDVVLARCGFDPVWVRRPSSAGIDLVSLGPDELEPAESLRDQLVEGRFLGFLPVVEFLRRLTRDIDWSPPPLRATFVVDDPNLHWKSYGHVDFRQLASHAREHGYHVAIATVPLDSWFVHRSAAAIFTSNDDVLSLAIHGNDHLRAELGRPRPEQSQLALLGQALRRMEAVERRRDVKVSRVMVAPHEVCSTPAMEALSRLGFDGLTYGWGERSPDRPLADWEIVDVRAGGLPILPRRLCSASLEEWVIRGYMNQPLILNAHPEDFADGLDFLAILAEEINRLGEVRWMSLAEVARTNVETCRGEDELHIRLFGRTASIEVPPGVRRLIVETARMHPDPEAELLRIEQNGRVSCTTLDGGRSPALQLGPGSTLLRLVRRDSVPVDTVRSRHSSAWAIGRRMMVESRDRAAPLIGRATAAAAWQRRWSRTRDADVQSP